MCLFVGIHGYTVSHCHTHFQERGCGYHGYCLNFSFAIIMRTYNIYLRVTLLLLFNSWQAQATPVTVSPQSTEEGEDHSDSGCQVGKCCPSTALWRPCTTEYSTWPTHPVYRQGLPWNVSEVAGWGGPSASDLGDSDGCPGWCWLCHSSGRLTWDPQKLSLILCPVLSYLFITSNYCLYQCLNVIILLHSPTLFPVKCHLPCWINDVFL